MPWWWKRYFGRGGALGVLLKLHCVGSHKLCICIEPVLLIAFYQNSYHLDLQEVVTHSVHVLLLVCSKWLLAQTWRKHIQGTTGKLS